MRWLAVLALIASAAVLIWWGPIEQPQSYHDFSGAQWWLIASNVPLIGVGIWALRPLGTGWKRATWLIFALGLIGAGVGSIFYHLNPNDSTLVWDRLPITIAFMALLAGVIGRQYAFWLPFLLVVGIASIVTWALSSDLRLYLLVQFYPAVVILLLRWRSGWLMAALGFFALAKGFEMADWFYGIAGHGVKHLLAAVAAYCAVRYPR